MKRAPQKRTAAKPAVNRKRKKPAKNAAQGKILQYSLIALLSVCILVTGYRYRHGFLYYLGFKTNKRIEALSKKEGRISNVRLYEIIARHKGKAFGIDVSHYQGKINWLKVKNDNAELPIQFVFIRATAGSKNADNAFTTNWKETKANGIMRGAYHYYRPNENSLKQAQNFIKTVKLVRGDLPPVLDIEQIPNEQSMDSLKSGLKRWLHTVERHYGVKPIIYSGESFYTDFLREEFEGYNLWIANYSFFEDEIRKEWLFWQFTDNGIVKGIRGDVDVDIYNGSTAALRELQQR